MTRTARRSAPHLSANRVARRIDLPGGYDPGFCLEHDLRHWGQDHFVSYHSADVFLPGARVGATCPFLLFRWRRLAIDRTSPLQELARIAHRIGGAGSS